MPVSSLTAASPGPPITRWRCTGGCWITVGTSGIRKIRALCRCSLSVLAGEVSTTFDLHWIRRVGTDCREWWDTFTEKHLFPIARKPGAWPSMRGKYLKGASESAINMIERWQPVTLNPEHPDRNALALIDELGLIDKHRLLYTSASTLGDVAISLVGESEVSAGRLLEQVERRIDDYLPFTEEQWILRAVSYTMTAHGQWTCRFLST